SSPSGEGTMRSMVEGAARRLPHPLRQRCALPPPPEGEDRLNLPASCQRLGAGGAVDFLAVAFAARLDIRRDGLSTGTQRIEEHVEHAGLAGELQLARVGLAHVEPRLAEAADEAPRIL